MRLARRPFAEEPLIVRIVGEHSLGKGVIDFIICLGDAGADGRGNSLDPGAERDHRRDRLIGDARRGSAPAGMGRADDAGLGIGQQHRRAVGGDHAEQQAGPVGDQRVGLRPLVMGHGFGDDHRASANGSGRRWPAARRA